MSDVPTNLERRSRPLALAGLAAGGILAGGLIGGTTNAINGAVSPAYFVRILGWEDVTDIHRAAIAQGIFEGLLFGVGFALLFAAVVGIMTRAACPFGFGLKHLLGIVGAVYACWILGGLLAVGLAALSPEFYHHAFRGVPEDRAGMLRYAWVGGSILGAQLGGLVSVILGLVVFRANWRRSFS
jgi:hypothetical protein